MCEAIESKGGQVFVSTPVTSFLFEGNKAVGVKLDNGKELFAPIVVSGLGYRVTENMIQGSSRTVDMSDTEKLGSACSPSNNNNKPSRPLQTQQGCGFIMANIGLKGKAKDLGITVANLWLQPACEKNGWDALKGVDDYMENPLTVPAENIPAGICFPSTKENSTGDDIDEDNEYHTCQILVPANWSWFEEYAPLSMLAFAANKPWAKHAPPHTERRNKEEYEALKKLWGERLLSLLFLHYPKIKAKKDSCIAFVNVSTPLSIENYTRPGLGAAIGLDVTPQRFIDNEEFKELNHIHPRFKNLYRAGQDYLMTGQVLASASGLICALRILGFVATIRFMIRGVRLMLPRFLIPNYIAKALASSEPKKGDSKNKKQN
jgi:all-trans-retinol 13,14-reductase